MPKVKSKVVVKPQPPDLREQLNKRHKSKNHNQNHRAVAIETVNKAAPKRARSVSRDQGSHNKIQKNRLKD